MKILQRCFMPVHHQRYRRSFILMPAAFVLIFSVFAAAQAPKKLNVDSSQPIHIQSDRLDAYQEKKLVVFSGNAVAVQGDKTIKAEHLLIYYKQQSDGSEKRSAMDMGTAGDIEKIEAQGHVVMTQGNRLVTSDQAVFYQDTRKIVMTGNAVMREGKNTVKGERIVVFFDEDRGIIEGSEGRRVTATIYPKETKEGDKE